MTGLLARRAGRTLVALVASSVVILLLWEMALHVLDVSPYIGKSPLEVWQYLFTDARFGPSAAENRAKLIGLLGVTLRDAGVGFVSGSLASTALASVFFLVPQLELAFLPLAMLMRTVPLVGFAPIIYLVFGNGTPTVALIGTIIVFFPVLINLALGLRSASPQAADLVRVYGGNRWTTLRMVAFPSALPNLFASVKIAIPLSLVAAMLYEWLFSLKGLGGEISVANAHSLYAETWAIAVIVAAVSIVVYNVVDFVEAPALALWGPNAGAFGS
ncbi:ABC transporter permease [Cryptosporangium phraense]|uniref:ABC transporter permease subunit n=1 Tax=Cryptosporangium phraense TaxID=2593070 RepID=A0A545AFR2_9ACTN|nr:ABC transporter permease subunit [Cryptosporangium phraense]TQS40182.1 ABC transporter permease subunit [Cryptosporangium phraense]